MKRLSFLILLVASYVATAQGQGIDLTISGKGGNNTLYGYYGAVAAAVDYESDMHFAIRGGAQYSTIGRVAAECRPCYYHDFDFGRVSGEILLGYTYQSSLNNYMTGVGNMPLEETATLAELFSKNNVTLCLQGHDHFREDLRLGGVRYTIVPTIGDLSHKPEYLVLHITNEGAELQWRDVW